MEVFTVKFIKKKLISIIKLTLGIGVIIIETIITQISQINYREFSIENNEVDNSKVQF